MAKTGRKRTTGKGAKPKLYKRSAVSYQHTLEVLLHLDKVTMEETAAQCYPGFGRDQLRNKKRLFYAWKAPFKSRLRHKWVEILVSQVRAAGVAVAFKMVPPSRANLATWIKDAWAELSAETIKSGFRKTRLGPSVDQDARVTPSIQDQDWGSLVALVRTYEVSTDAIDAAKDMEETCDVYKEAIV
ncbi:hypothetical protein PI125_g6510 [Phytophthora idaei]|nr:hypothetical protein PI125_g6510 [Phytophthora idaei]KAG3163041.1 hypothetical protein PI126_g5707 [Phytophthora idaei]